MNKFQKRKKQTKALLEKLGKTRTSSPRSLQEKQMGAGKSRFKKLSDSIKKKEGLSEESANAIAASIGRKKYGAKKFAAMAKKGRAKKA